MEDKDIMDHSNGNGARKHNKLGLVSGVYIPACLNIFSILLFLRFGSILGQIGLVGMLGMPPDLHHLVVLYAT